MVEVSAHTAAGSSVEQVADTAVDVLATGMLYSDMSSSVPALSYAASVVECDLQHGQSDPEILSLCVSVP